jgi:hypothetical protein
MARHLLNDLAAIDGRRYREPLTSFYPLEFREGSQAQRLLMARRGAALFLGFSVMLSLVRNSPTRHAGNGIDKSDRKPEPKILALRFAFPRLHALIVGQSCLRHQQNVRIQNYPRKHDFARWHAHLPSTKLPMSRFQSLADILLPSDSAL